MEELIGKSVRGFNFDETEPPGFSSYMSAYVNLVGEITDINYDYKTVGVTFPDGGHWWYPLEQVKEHLVEQKHLKRYTAKCSSCKEYFGTNNKRCNICNTCAEYIKPIVETVPSQKVLTPLDKVMAFLIDKKYFIGNDLYEEYKKLKEEEKELFFTIACRGIYGMSSESDAKKFIDEKFE